MYRVRLPDGRYLLRIIAGHPVWTESKESALSWKRHGGAWNAADWLIKLGHLKGHEFKTRHQRNPEVYIDREEESLWDS